MLNSSRSREPFHLHPICFSHPAARIGDPLLYMSCVGEDEQTFAVIIKATGGVNSGDRDIVSQGRASARIGELAEDVKGFIEKNNLHVSSSEISPRAEHSAYTFNPVRVQSRQTSLP